MLFIYFQKPLTHFKKKLKLLFRIQHILGTMLQITLKQAV